MEKNETFIEEKLTVSKKTKIIKFTIIALLIITLILLYARFIGTKGLEVNEYPIKTTYLDESYDGLKIAHFSDLHYGSTVTLDDIKKIVKKINNENPHLIIFTGDLIDKDVQISESEFAKLKDELNKLDPEIEILAVKGNHDYDHEYFDTMVEELKWHFLDNTYEYVYYKSDTPIVFVGLDDLMKGNPDYTNAFSYLNEVGDSLYTIVLAHEPDQISDINNYNFNLFLAGHSHLGQVRLPLIGAIYTPMGSKKYYDEHYKVNNADLYISGGIGTSVIKFRLLNKPSFNLYRFYTK